MSWANWSWSGHWALIDAAGKITTVDDRTGAPTGLPDALTRVYPQAIAGVPTRWSFDPTSNVFEMAITPKADAEGPTVIFVPARTRYPNGWTLNVDTEPTSTEGLFDPTTQRLALELDPTEAHTLCISPESHDCTA